MRIKSAPVLAGLALMGFSLAFLAGRCGAEPELQRGLQVRASLRAAPADREARVALVIGNGAYGADPLRNPVNDARAMASAVQDAGFEVIELENAGQREMRSALEAFGDRIAQGGVGLFYFAGHGVQVRGRNYLLPAGVALADETRLASQTVALDEVLDRVRVARNRLNILVVDACRTNPFGAEAGAQALAPVEAPAGTLLAFATAPGQSAGDGRGANSTYTAALVAQLRAPGLGLEEVFKRTRAEVLRVSGGRQTPWETSSVVGDFAFLPERGQGALPSEGPPSGSVVRETPSLPVPLPVQASGRPLAGAGVAAPAVSALPPAPVPEAQAGGLQVLVNVPGAQVTVNGDPAGEAGPGSALNLAELPAGDVQVRVEAPGFAPVERFVAIDPGRWTQDRVQLRRLPPLPPAGTGNRGEPPDPANLPGPGGWVRGRPGPLPRFR